MRNYLYLLILSAMFLLLVGCPPKADYCPDYDGARGKEECEQLFEDMKGKDVVPGEDLTDEYPVDKILEKGVPANNTLPVVAVHVSEISRNDWKYGENENVFQHKMDYFETYTAFEDILNSFKIPFVELNDSEIENGELLVNGTPKYPILFSLNNRMITKDGKKQIERYVKNGGTLFFNYFTFTETPQELEENKDCFIISGTGLKCQNKPYGVKDNSISMDLIEKMENHFIVKHMPEGEVAWRMSAYRFTRYDNFLVQAEDATELIRGSIHGRSWSFQNPLQDVYGRITYKGNETQGAQTAINDYGKGSYIYNAQLNLFWGMYEGEPVIYNTIFALKSIEYAFNKTNTPKINIRPWGRDKAAFMLRFDVEPSYHHFTERFPRLVNVVDEHNKKATFYILADQARQGKPYENYTFYSIKDWVIKNLILSAQKKGMLIGSHSTWHIGPDFDGKDALDNINISLNMFEEVLGKRPEHWVSPAFGANFDNSLEIIEELGLKTAGEQKFSYLPHFALSPDKEGKHYSFLEIPTSDIYHEDFHDGEALITAMKMHSNKSVESLVDMYYKHGGLINPYGHLEKGNPAKIYHLLEYIKTKEKVWYTNPEKLYHYWKKRENIKYGELFYDGSLMAIRLHNKNNEAREIGMDIKLPKNKKVIMAMYENSSAEIKKENGRTEIYFTLPPGKKGNLKIWFE